MSFYSQKTKKTITLVIVIVLVLAMVVPLVISAFV